jgi:hypothetical protein
VTDNPDNTVTAPVIDTAPPMSWDAAQARKNEMLNDPATRDKIMQGDVETRAEYDRVIRSLAFGQPPPGPADSRESIVEHLRQHADISEAVADEIRSDRASTPWEHQRALQRRDQLFRDEAWREKYARGDQRAQTEVALINLILSRRIRDNPQEK